MTQTGDGDLARKLAKDERLKLDAAADARTTKVRDDLSFASTGTVGSLANKLNIKEVDNDYFEIARSAWCIPTLNKFFGRKMCWAHVCTTKNDKEALTACNHAGEPGHEEDGDMHKCTQQQREHIRQNARDFRPEWYRKRRSAPSGND